VVSHGVSNSTEFASAWNASPENMANVVIFVHGNSRLSSNMGALSSLDPRTIDTLLLLSCNMAHLNVSNNFAEQVFARNNIRQMVAWDGALTIGEHTGTGGWTTVGDPDRGNFKLNLPAGSTRQPLGMIHFMGSRRASFGTSGTSYASIDQLFRRLGV
jgi:hypothetical protein